MRSLSAKLIAALFAVLAGALALLGWANLRMLRDNLETTAITAERRMADIIFRSTREGMLRNDRAQQLEIIRNIGAQPDVRKIRIISKSGHIRTSTAPQEEGTLVDKRADACVACHASGSRPIEKPASSGTFRIYRMGHERVIGLMRPIENEPACANAACHAHPASHRILGVLDVVVSLAPVDRALDEHMRRMRAQAILSGVVILAFVGLLVWVLVSRPLKRLIAGVHQLAAKNLSYRFRLKQRDEIGELAGAFDNMAGEVEELNRTLEARIRRKSSELELAQEKLIHSEKLASLGQLSAAVAHEINNPLAGIYTYAKLIEKKLAPSKPVLDWVQTIQHESRRCGGIVNNLLVFARRQHTEMAPAEVQAIFQRTASVVQHKLEMQSIDLATEVAEIPPIVCDASQIQQVLTAIIINAVDAIAGAGHTHGNVRLKAALLEDGRADLSVTNDGPPIPADVLPKIFEPFFSTKQAASGVGLGLSVAYGIVKRHGGEIQVDTGPETTFHVILPVGESGPPASGELEKTDVRQVVHSDR
jgi:two-component system NtrC family sensor kinase